MALRATAKAHPMQGLVKYHGLKDWALRIPYHDSISVNIDALWTKTTVELGDFENDTATIGGEAVKGNALERCTTILDLVRRMAGLDLRARVTSENSLPLGTVKGVGFSSSGGAALAAAAYKAARLDELNGWDLQLISRLARRLAGSACRSVVGGYGLWHAGNSDESSYAQRIAGRETLDMAMVIVPLGADLSTEDAHREVESSIFFDARIRSASRRVQQVREAIERGDLPTLGELVELDSLELHAVTMTGASRTVIYRPESITVLQEVKTMKREGTLAYFSMQTGPSVFINTYPENAAEVSARIQSLGLKTIISTVGGEVALL